MIFGIKGIIVGRKGLYGVGTRRCVGTTARAKDGWGYRAGCRRGWRRRENGLDLSNKIGMCRLEVFELYKLVRQ